METVHPSRGRPPLPDGPFLVVGLARSGVSAARALAFRGEQVTGVDAGHPSDLTGLDDASVPYFLDEEGQDRLDGVRTVVKSPGVPQDAAVVSEARTRGIEVIGELELGWRMVEAPFLAVTGTNGKTTTTELAAHLFRAAGRPVEAVGNVGKPLTALAIESEPNATVVCECSSFQLEDTSAFAPECAVFLNLAPDHLDRYTDFDAYGKAKLRIFRNQVEGDLAVLNLGERWLADQEIPGAARRVGFLPPGEGDGNGVADVRVAGGEIEVEGRPLLPVDEVGLIGPHNVANAMAAAAATLGFGLPEESVAEGLAGFTGVAHRLEPVGELDGVLWVNDSKATNVTATLTALASCSGGIRLILGGRGKGEDYAALADPVAESCIAVYLVGENADEIGSALGASGVELVRSGDLPAAVDAAARTSRPGETVLLSPAAASFDQFRDFEERGDRFRSLVEALDAS
ncbi:MAG: UDP-N-acetylmuramoyl-L-alanine--D-glutamate ligase [Solirubrobacterales bacterium]